MKRHTKTLLTISGVCFGLGIMLCVIGLVLGYQPGSVLRQYEEKMEIMQDENYVFSNVQEFREISTLKLSIGAADCRILSWQGDEIKVETEDKEQITCKKQGSTLTVSYREDDSLIRWFYRRTDGVIKIYIPEETCLELLKLEGGAANIVMEGLSCRQLKMEVGAGNFSYEGAVEEEADVEVGAGNVDLRLEGEADDFNYKISCGLGSISVENGPNIAGIGENNMDNHADKDLKMECGLGNISVIFQ